MTISSTLADGLARQLGGWHREPLNERFTPWSARLLTAPLLLFRFSALADDDHRIHYDEGYTTGTEDLPGRVVYGQLLAMFMSEVVRGRAAGRVQTLWSSK